MEADAQGDYQAMSVAVNKRMLWPSRRKIINKSRQRSRMRLKLYIVITTKEQANSKLECRVKEKLVCERDHQVRMAVGSTSSTSLQKRNSRNLRRKQWRTKLRMK